MKKCPFCAESIQDEAIKCRYCQSFLTTDGTDEGPAEESDATDDAKAAREDDGWEAESSSKSSDEKSSSSPVLLKPEVDRGASAAPKSSPFQPKAASAEPSPESSSRRVLYSGSPSWRAFFGQYALVLLGGLLAPFICYWIAGLVDAGTFTKVLTVIIPLLMAGVAFLAVSVYRRSKVFRVTTTNIESEYGVVSKKIDVLELWRCRDVRYKQSLFDRILRIAHIEIMTADVTTPQLCIEGLPASRQLFEKIRDSIEIQRQARNVVGFVQ